MDSWEDAPSDDENQIGDLLEAQRPVQEEGEEGEEASPLELSRDEGVVKETEHAQEPSRHDEVVRETEEPVDPMLQCSILLAELREMEQAQERAQEASVVKDRMLAEVLEREQSLREEYATLLAEQAAAQASPARPPKVQQPALPQAQAQQAELHTLLEHNAIQKEMIHELEGSLRTANERAAHAEAAAAAAMERAERAQAQAMEALGLSAEPSAEAAAPPGGWCDPPRGGAAGLLRDGRRSGAREPSPAPSRSPPRGAGQPRSLSSDMEAASAALAAVHASESDRRPAHATARRSGAERRAEMRPMPGGAAGAAGVELVAAGTSTVGGSGGGSGGDEEEAGPGGARRQEEQIAAAAAAAMSSEFGLCGVAPARASPPPAPPVPAPQRATNRAAAAPPNPVAEHGRRAKPSLPVPRSAPQDPSPACCGIAGRSAADERGLRKAPTAPPQRPPREPGQGALTFGRDGRIRPVKRHPDGPGGRKQPLQPFPSAPGRAFVD